MEKLSNDLVELIMKKLQLDDILLFSITNKEYYKMLDDLFYLNIAIDIYGKNFSKGFLDQQLNLNHKFYKIRINKIERFQTRVYKSISRRWTNNDFYSFWSLDYF